MADFCKGCGKPIVWGARTSATGERVRVPCDPRPPVYRVVGVWPDDGTPKVARVDDAMVTHFATCPNANDFSRSKRKETV